jgi:hypothetical protein
MKSPVILLAGLFCLVAGAHVSAETGNAKTPGGPNPTWDKMTTAQRKKYMKVIVHPKMKEVFVAFDAKRFKTFTCLSCHGDSGVDGTYKMPNPKLLKLPATPRGFQALAEKEPTMMQFMGTKVKPAMAALMGMPEFTPKTPTGFGCGKCHTSEK